MKTPLETLNSITNIPKRIAIEDKSDIVKESLRQKGAIFLDNYVSQDKSISSIIFQRWMLKGNIITIEINLNTRDYRMIKPSKEESNISEDIKYIESL